MPGGSSARRARFHVADISPDGSSQLRPHLPAPASTECQHRTSSVRAEPIANIIISARAGSYRLVVEL
jgi:hypothetical protein